MKIIGTGLSGLVGSRITQLLPEYTFTNISRTTGVDITNREEVIDAIKKSDGEVVLHLAAKTNVDVCEEEKLLGKDSESWKINVLGTENVVSACEEAGKKLVYISTDMVFSGDMELGKKYTEDDVVHPLNWYAQTKWEGENMVAKSRTSFLILRIAYPYRANFPKKEYVRIFIDLLKNGKTVRAVTDNYFTPTFIDDIAFSLPVLLSNNAIGIYHLVGGETISPYEAAIKIAETFGFNKNLISQTTRKEFFQGKAVRGFNLSLNNDKITKLGVNLTSFGEGIKEIKRQLSNS